MVSCSLLATPTGSRPAEKLQLQPPIGGLRKHRRHQLRYESINASLQKREWASRPEGSKEGGATWIELLILYDTQGYQDGQVESHVNIEGQRRAAKRNMGKASRGRMCPKTCVLIEEMTGFKNIARYVIRKDATSNVQQTNFTPGEDQHIGRLVDFAILGHQATINGWCVATDEEKKCCEEAIAKQRMGATAKAWKTSRRRGEMRT